MLLVYILLGIIAIGVLLLSNTGKNILTIIALLVGISLTIYVIFWLIMLVLALLTSNETVKRTGVQLIGMAILGIIIAIFSAIIQSMRAKYPKIDNLIKKLHGYQRYYGWFALLAFIICFVFVVVIMIAAI